MIELPTEAEPVKVIQADCLDVLPTLPDSSFDLILADPPYHRVKGEAWDRQWATDGDYLAWLGRVADEWRRVLRPNGSLYCFASPRMAARVELLIGERFNVLNRITWQKDAGWAKRQCKEEQRAFFPASEGIVFAEHYGADNMAKGEAGYAAKCDELRGFVFEPLRAYLDGERIRAGFDYEDCNVACGHRREGGMAGRHYFSPSQWCLPTRENYEKLRAAMNWSGGNFLRREYEDLRREYEDLRREYEDLRRPFTVSADVPYTDVWTFPTVNTYRGKHPCEKPGAMIRHIVKASSRPRAMVLDCFAGSGITGVVCGMTDRRCLLIERESAYAEIARQRIAKATAPGLFAGAASPELTMTGDTCGG